MLAYKIEFYSMDLINLYKECGVSLFIWFMWPTIYIVEVVGFFEKGNSPTNSLKGLEFVG